MKQYSLSELCDYLGSVIHEALDDSYWVRAEISSISYSGGHCYMELIEKGERDILSAKIRATCWSNTYRIICSYFQQETGEMLRNGMQVLVEVTVNFHPVYGLSLNIQNIDPQYTMGDLARQRLETIKKLQEEGVIDMNKSCPLASVLKKIAVISAKSAAGYGDFCNQLTNNEYGFQFRVTLYPAIMQGDKAAASIVQALKQIASGAEEPDVVVIIRGGGATTDLSCFDDYTLALYCAQIPYPVISGIGHTRDISILDMVAHTAVKTPTAAAEFIIAQNTKQLVILQDLQQRISRSAERFILLKRQRLQTICMQVKMASQNYIEREKSNLSLLEKSILMHNPEKFYSLGYSFTSVNGKLIKSPKDVKAGDEIITELKEGKVRSIVVDK